MFQIATLTAFEWQSAMLSGEGTRMVWHSPLSSSHISRIRWYFNLVCRDLADSLISLAAAVAASLSPPRNQASGRDALGHTEHTNLSLDLRHRNSTFLCSLAFFSSFLSKQKNGWLARSRAAENPTDLATDLKAIYIHKPSTKLANKFLYNHAIYRMQ